MKKLFFMLFFVFILGIGGVVFWINSQNKKPPQIVLNENVAYYKAGQDKNELLKYVSAYDSKGTDITSSIQVSYAKEYPDLKIVNVKYVVVDSDHNVTSATFDIPFLSDSDTSSEGSNPEPNVER